VLALMVMIRSVHTPMLSQTGERSYPISEDW